MTVNTKTSFFKEIKRLAGDFATMDRMRDRGLSLDELLSFFQMGFVKTKPNGKVVHITSILESGEAIYDLLVQAMNDLTASYPYKFTHDNPEDTHLVLRHRLYGDKFGIFDIPYRKVLVAFEKNQKAIQFLEDAVTSAKDRGESAERIGTIRNDIATLRNLESHLPGLESLLKSFEIQVVKQ